MNRKNIGTNGSKVDIKPLSKILDGIIEKTYDPYSTDANEKLRKYSVNVKHLEYSLKSKKHK